MSYAQPPLIREEQFPDKEHRILDAALRVFADRGYHRSTVAHIAAEARVAAGTIYLYFRHKQDLLGAIFRGDPADYLAETREILTGLPAGIPHLETLVRRHLEFCETRPVFARVLQIHLREADPDLKDIVGPVARGYFDLVDHVVHSGRATGAFPYAGSDRMGRNIVFGAIDATVTAWVLADTPEPLVTQTESLTRMLARALGAGS